MFKMLFYQKNTVQPLPTPRLTGCLVSGGSSILSVNWILLMVYEAGEQLESALFDFY